MVLFSIICLLMVLVLPDSAVIWLSVFGVLYIAQLIEVFFSSTQKLLSEQSSWDDLEVFRLWFYELKKCRPVLTYQFTPTEQQITILADLYKQEQVLEQAYVELQN